MRKQDFIPNEIFSEESINRDMTLTTDLLESLIRGVNPEGKLSAEQMEIILSTIRDYVKQHTDALNVTMNHIADVINATRAALPLEFVLPILMRIVVVDIMKATSVSLLRGNITREDMNELRQTYLNCVAGQFDVMAAKTYEVLDR